MTPAHTRRAVLAAAGTATLALSLATTIQGAPPWAWSASAAEPAAHYSRLLTAPLDPDPPSLQSTSPSPVKAAPSPCHHNHNGQLVVVSIKRQHAWACAGRRTVLSTPVTTGARGDRTPRGTFAVQGLIRHATLTTDDGSSYPVGYWIPFKYGEWGFHDASWQKIPFGSSRFVTGGSHGCVHVPKPAMRALFHWVHYGTTIRVH